MTTETENNKRSLETLVKGSLEEAQKRIQGLKPEAEKLVQSLKSRGDASRKELEALLEKVDAKQLNKVLEHPRVKELAAKATETRAGLTKRFDGLQTRVVESVGVASQAQMKEIRGELSKLSKKLDDMVSVAATTVANGAAHVTGKKASAKSSAPQV